MSKSTKIISSVVAIALVIAAMIVGIYAATTAGATISASVSWQASAGIELTLRGYADNNPTDTNNIAKDGEGNDIDTGYLTVDTTTTNANAQEVNTANKTLDIDFIDTDSADGVNTAQPITFTYTVKNDSTSVGLVVILENHPESNDQKNVVVDTVKASVASEASVDVWADLVDEAKGVTVDAGDTLTITITITVKNANADVTDYDAGVKFQFDKATTQTA